MQLLHSFRCCLLIVNYAGVIQRYATTKQKPVFCVCSSSYCCQYYSNYMVAVSTDVGHGASTAPTRHRYECYYPETFRKICALPPLFSVTYCIVGRGSWQLPWDSKFHCIAMESSSFLNMWLIHCNSATFKFRNFIATKTSKSPQVETTVEGF